MGPQLRVSWVIVCDNTERGFERRPNEEPSAAKVVADGLIARPLGLATTLAGTGLFIVTLPFSIPSGSVRESAQGMIVRARGLDIREALGPA